MKGLFLSILGDRGFWTSASSLLTLLLVKVLHVPDDTATQIVVAVQTICLIVDAKAATMADAPTLPPKG